MTKPLPALGLVIGVIAAYVGLGAASYAAPRLSMRVQQYRDDFGSTLPWLVLLIVVAVVLGLLMMVPAIGSGVTTGVGALLTVAGLAVALVPVQQLFHLIKIFDWPGSRYGSSYMLFDGSVLLFGIPLLLVGMRRWAQDAKLAKLSHGPQQPQQWGGYPGQQPPPQYPGQQPRQ